MVYCGAVVLAVLGLLSSVALAEEGDHGFEQKLRGALEAATDQLQISNTTQLTSTCFKQFGSSFDCQLFSHTSTPSTVHELTPYDISIVAALGDSVTAAMGAPACTVLDDLLSYRGQSWSIGGNRDLSRVTTLPNILRQYNPNIKGFSINTGGPNSKNAHFNVAVVGAISQDMPTQAETLVARMKSDLTDEEFNNGWKMVSLWIGGNNLCAYCNNKEKHSPENYVNYIRDALDILKEKLPRTFVNLVQIIDVTRLEPLKGIVCNLVHGAVCKCASGQYQEETSAASTAYQEGLSQLVGSDRYDDRDDFAVVLQPFFEGVELPYKNGKPDKSYFAPDCFHFSTKGHSEGAKALWKNMYEPVGSKTSGWELGQPLYCPTEDNKYFYTKKNSPPPSSFGDTAHVTAPSSDDGSNLIGVITGSAVGVAALVATVLAVTAVLAYKLRKRQSRGNQLENLPLVQT